MTSLPIGWLRRFAAFLAVPNLVTGAWAVLSPRGFYDDYPTLGPALVSADPPYNPHLVTDAGSGFLAVGAVLLIAAIARGLGVLRLAFVALIAFSAPHAIYHAAHPSPQLSEGSNALTVALLGAQVVLPVVLLVLSRSETGGQGARTPAAPAGVTE